MLTPLPGCTPTKPGSATLPFFGVVPAIVDYNGKEIEGTGNGILVIKKPWPSIARTVVGNHERYEMTYFHKFKGYFSTGDGKFFLFFFLTFFFLFDYGSKNKVQSASKMKFFFVFFCSIIEIEFLIINFLIFYFCLASVFFFHHSLYLFFPLFLFPFITNFIIIIIILLTHH